MLLVLQCSQVDPVESADLDLPLKYNWRRWCPGWLLTLIPYFVLVLEPVVIYLNAHPTTWTKHVVPFFRIELASVRNSITAIAGELT
jgi:hypothetical protein